jgi:hypothetical protein
MLRSLVSANQHRRTTHAILSSLLQANQMADTVELGELVYDEVIVGVGPIPSVRLCWRAEEVATVMPAVPTNPVPASSSTPIAAPQSVFGQGSFFERRTPPPTPVAVQSTAPAVSVSMAPSSLATSAVEAPHSDTAAGGKEDPLARFKKMPDFSKPRR